jgi:hypothetical protein
VKNNQVHLQEKTMAIIRDIHLNLETSHVMRREGIRKYGSVKQDITTLIHELLAEVETNRLLEPAIAYEIYPVTEINKQQLSVAGVKLHGSLFASVLPNAEELAVLLCTIGPRLESRVTEYLGRREPLRGTLLDGIGSAAVDSLAQAACRAVTKIALIHQQQASSPFSPGMPDFPITEQKQLFQLIPAEQIGVSLSASGVMVPLKSVSMVIGIGQGMLVRTQAEVCRRCNLSRTCHYRFVK